MTRRCLEHIQLLGWCGHLKFSPHLLHLLWVPPEPRCLLAAVERLADLYERHPDCFTVITLPKPRELKAWSHTVKTIIRDLPKDQQSVVATMTRADPLEVIQQKEWGGTHPAYGYISGFPVYSSLLVTPPPLSQSIPGFDRLAALLIGQGLADHLEVDESAYIDYVQSFAVAKASKHTNSKIQPPDPPLAAIQRLREGDRAVRTLQRAEGLDALFDALSISETTAEAAKAVDEFATKLASAGEAGRIKGQLLGLARTLRDQPIREVKRRTGTKSSSTSGTRPKPEDIEGLAAHLDMERLSTYLSIGQIEANPLLTLSIPIPPPVPTPKPDDIDLVIDLPDVEVNGPPEIEVTQIDFEEQEEEATLEAWTHRRAEMMRRLAELQPFNLDYVPIDTRLALLADLRRTIERQGHESYPAQLLLTSLATGRAPTTLSGRIQVTAAAPDFLTVSEETILVIQQNPPRIHTRINQVPLKNTDYANTRAVSTWLCLPDVFGLASMPQPEPAASQPAPFDFDGLVSHLSLRSSQVWQMLPKWMHQQEGEFSTAVLITDWAPENAAVNLHYLTPKASVVATRYLNGITSLLDLPLQAEDQATCQEQIGWIGIPTCPTQELLEHAIDTLREPPTDGDFRKLHNHMALNTIMMLSYAIGQRHAIDIVVGGIELLRDNLAYFKEKGGRRLVVLPEHLAQQLKTYDLHRSVTEAVYLAQTGAESLHQHLFFLFDADGNPTAFKPGSFGKYLEALGGQFSCQLNALRRLVFTDLYETGKFGSVIDHYIGHASEGRRPFAEMSGVRMQSLRSVAMHVNDRLLELNWPIAMGLTAGPP